MVPHVGTFSVRRVYKLKLNYSFRGRNCHQKVTGCVGGPSFNTLSKQTPKQRANMKNGPSVPLFLGALGVGLFRLGGWDVAKAAFATGGHVSDVLQAVVQWACSRGIWEGEVFKWQSETSLHALHIRGGLPGEHQRALDKHSPPGMNSRLWNSKQLNRETSLRGCRV